MSKKETKKFGSRSATYARNFISDFLEFQLITWAYVCDSACCVLPPFKKKGRTPKGSKHRVLINSRKYFVSPLGIPVVCKIYDDVWASRKGKPSAQGIWLHYM